MHGAAEIGWRYAQDLHPDWGERAELLFLEPKA